MTKKVPSSTCPVLSQQINSRYQQKLTGKTSRETWDNIVKDDTRIEIRPDCRPYLKVNIPYRSDLRSPLYFDLGPDGLLEKTINGQNYHTAFIDRGSHRVTYLIPTHGKEDPLLANDPLVPSRQKFHHLYRPDEIKDINDKTKNTPPLMISEQTLLDWNEYAEAEVKKLPGFFLIINETKS